MQIRKGFIFQFDCFKSIYIIEDIQYNDYMNPIIIYYKIFSYEQIIKGKDYNLFVRKQGNNMISDKMSGSDWNIINDINKPIFLGKMNQDLAFDKNWNLTTSRRHFNHFLKIVN